MEDASGSEIDLGKYCPLTMSSQLMSRRWTFEIIRELLCESSRFNSIARGLPGISRSLLSTRLTQLEQAGVLTHLSSGVYRLTDAGVALGPIVRGLAEWGEHWLIPEAELVGAKIDFVMWDVRQHAKRIDEMSGRIVICFEFAGVPVEKSKHWLVFDDQGTDLCYIDPGFDIDLYVESKFSDFASVWNGNTTLAKAIADDLITLHGDRGLTLSVEKWLSIPKREPC